MLTFSKLEKKGNLGNQLFHLASTIGIAREKGHTYSFPEWRYEEFFDFNFPKTPENAEFKYIKEKQFHVYDWDLKQDSNYDLEGWLQSEQYFDIPYTREVVFKFKDDFIDPLLKKNSFLFDRKTILISVRRGDFIHHPFYFQLSYRFYFTAILEYFPDWEDRNLIFISDDIAYCKYHFGHFDNAYFLEGFSPMEQLAIGSRCDDYIISNSTFSWWVAWLGEKEDTRIVRPLSKFRGKKSTLSNEKDFFPDRWIIHDHGRKNIPSRYSKLYIKANTYLFGKFIYNKLRGMKYRIIRLPNKLGWSS
ncbi:alpha-1,2-fucosyltransferase [Christiangramia crocea]|uniref:Alpha-1,2-fucosyltransferase n=1 Tax=Christiangramia crocea TaxID=2904124 RepID=A0A9X1UZ86_9FLAO|nr:alpha-1,2-fucosyltransferase [Gramella crocea]MCG9973010.1 alpha-1,2-fucosyltransferase [Gramella crocea]